MNNVTIVTEPGPLADLLAARLSASEAVTSCQAVAPAAADLRPGDTVVWALPATDWRGRASGAARIAQELLPPWLEAGGGHLVLISSAAVNEASHHHAGMVSEERLAPARFGNAIPGHWLEVERLAAAAVAGSDGVLTVLRPTAVPIRGARDDYFSRLFGGRLASTCGGFDPSLQLLSPDDLAGAVAAAVEKRRPGVCHVAPAGVVPLRQALRAAGSWRLPLPCWVQALARKVLAPLGLAASGDQLRYVRYSWTVRGQKIRRELGFQPTRSSIETAAAMRRRPRPVEAVEHDPYGMDKHYVARLSKLFFPFLHNCWWRIEYTGLEHVPRHGRAVLTGIHRGHQPWDGVMAMYLLVRELGRYVRFLVHPTLVKFPYLAPYMIKCGGIHACWENASWVLEQDEIVAVFPEGIRGAFSLYRDVYKLRKFGRHEFVKMALRHRAPIVPFVTVGSAEIFPIFANLNWGWWKRFSEWPYFPITPTLSTVPLPSKWHTMFLEPLHVEKQYPPAAADDPATVRAISREVRSRIEAAIAEMLGRRRSIFFGSIFDRETADREPTAADVSP